MLIKHTYLPNITGIVSEMTFPLNWDIILNHISSNFDEVSESNGQKYWTCRVHLYKNTDVNYGGHGL